MNKTIELNEGAKTVYKALSEGIKPKSGTSIAFLQMIVRSAYNMAVSLRKEADDKIIHNRNTLSVKLADEENRNIEADYNNKIADIKTAVRKHADEVLTAKHNAIDKYTMIPITDDMFRMLQTIQMRTGELSDYDWSQYNRYFATNYQATMVFVSYAKERDKTIIPAFVPEKSHERLDMIGQMADRAITHLNNPESDLYAMSFLKDDPNSNLAKLIQEIDQDAATIIPAERRTVIDRLKEAKDKAYRADNFGLSARIDVFIERNINELATPEEMKDALFEQAEALIAESANKKKA